MSEEKILQPEQNYGPGNVLRAKREEYEWSVDAVAEALHLSTSAVKAIEADRYEDLPGATYVMGYWRSYARLLGVDIEDTIEANKRNLNVVTAEASGMDVIRPVHRKKSGGGVVWLLLLIALGALGYYSWQQNFFGLLEKFQTAPDKNIEQVLPVEKALPEKVSKKDQMLRPLTPAETGSATRNAVTEIVSDNSFPVAKPGNVKAGSALQANDVVTAKASTDPLARAKPIDSTSTTNSASTDSRRAMGQTGLVLSSSGTEPTSRSEAPEAGLASEETKPAEAQAEIVDSTQNTISAQSDSGTPSGAAAASSVTASNDSELILTVTKKNWVDVRDKANNRLESRSGSVGDVIKVKGIPPFYVSVTPPDSVTVRYNGKAFTLPAKNNGLSARFKLDKTLQAL